MSYFRILKVEKRIIIACYLSYSKGVREVVAKVLDFEDAAQEPTEWPTSPALGVCNLLKRLELKPSDISRWEINEAFAMVVTVNIDLIKKEFGGEGINVEQVMQGLINRKMTHP